MSGYSGAAAHELLERDHMRASLFGIDVPSDVGRGCPAAGAQLMGGRVLVVEDHVLVAIGLQLALSARGWDVQTISGPTALDVVASAQRFQPQAVLLDIHIGAGVGSGIELIGPLLLTGAQVVMLTAESRRMVLAECLEAGASGWIGKGATLDEVDTTLRHVIAGGTMVGRTDRAELLEELRLERVSTVRAHASFERLTQREAIVLAAMVDGLSADEIAEVHFVALTTVRSQIRAVLRKLRVRSQLAAVALAVLHPELMPDRVRAGDRRRVLALSASGPGPDCRR
jgi:DNA-binding NarL/FixJ family response regulator